MRRLLLAIATGILMISALSCRRESMDPEEALEIRAREEALARQVVPSVSADGWNDGEDPDYTPEDGE